MRHKTLLAILGFALASVAFNVSAQDRTYKISFDVSHNGKAVGSPTVAVREGTEGSMELSGADGYKITFIATAAGEGKTKVATTFTSPQGESSATLIVKDGQPASVSDGSYEFKFVVSPRSS